MSIQQFCFKKGVCKFNLYLDYRNVIVGCRSEGGGGGGGRPAPIKSGSLIG